MRIILWLVGVLLLIGAVVFALPHILVRSVRMPSPGATTGQPVANDQPRPIMQVQVVLDRLGFGTGVIDGKEGQSFTAALRGFQESRGLAKSGTLDAPTRAALAEWTNIPATRVVTISADLAKGPFTPVIPRDPAAQAKLVTMGYRNLAEKLAERFHTDTETLIAINAPGTKIGAGLSIRVPNIGDAVIDAAKVEDAEWRAMLATLGVGSAQPAAERVMVDKSEAVLKVFDAKDRLIAQFPATMGSEHDPLPIGKWTIKGVSYNPPFHYNPDLFWDASSRHDKELLPPGPNGPVGVVWIDLSKPHYGIHGTPEPQSIGRTESHGCIRLTNWDAARLAMMVRPGTPAHFVP